MEEKQLSIDTDEGTLEEHNVETPPKKMSKSEILAALSAAVKAGNIPSSAARSMRLELGMTQADFTRKQKTPAERKAKRKMQKASRKKNRGTGKGQKRG